LQSEIILLRARIEEEQNLALSGCHSPEMNEKQLHPLMLAGPKKSFFYTPRSWNFFAENAAACTTSAILPADRVFSALLHLSEERMGVDCVFRVRDGGS